METKLEQIAAKAVTQRPKSLVREIRTPRSVGTGGGRPPPVTRWILKRSHGRASEAPPDERGGYRYVRPTATASHLDSTQPRRSRAVRRRTASHPEPTLGAGTKRQILSINAERTASSTSQRHRREDDAERCP